MAACQRKANEIRWCGDATRPCASTLTPRHASGIPVGNTAALVRLTARTKRCSIAATQSTAQSIAPPSSAAPLWLTFVRCQSSTTSSAANVSLAASSVRAAITKARDVHGERCGCFATRRAASASCDVHSCGLSPIRTRSAIVNIPRAGSASNSSSISWAVISDISQRAATKAAASGATRLARSLVSTQPRTTWSGDGSKLASIGAVLRKRASANGHVNVMLPRCDSGNAITCSGVSMPCGRLAPAAAVLDISRVGTATATGSGDSFDTCITRRPPQSATTNTRCTTSPPGTPILVCTTGVPSMRC